MAVGDLTNSSQAKPEGKITLLLEDLAALEDYIYDLFVFSPLPICFISPIGVILEANPAFERIANFGFGEVVGRPVEMVFKEKEIQELARRTLAKGWVEGREMSFFPKEQKEILVQVFTRARQDEEGKNVGYFLGLFDLTKIKKTEKELREAQVALMSTLKETEEARRISEEERTKTQTIIENFTDGLLVLDKQKRVILVNPKAEGFLRVRIGEVIEKTFSQLTKLKQIAPLAALLGEEVKGVFREELELGKDLTVEVSTVPLKRKRKKIGTLVVLHDITREKRIEEMKTEFVSLAAHQLRTPLSAVKWTLRMLLDGDLGEINEQQREFTTKTYQSNERMINLVNDLLNVTRIEEGRYLYRLTQARMEEVVRQVAESLREEIVKRRIKFSLRQPKKPLPSVMIDLEKISLAVQNLLENAIGYTAPGGKVTISLKSGQEQVEFWIEDTGIGIPENQKERVFSKFFRGANVVRMETEGTGLGLFITKNIIEAHGGTIGFKSEENVGSVFYFTLPIKKVW